MDNETRAPVATLITNTHPCLSVPTSTGGNTSGLVSMTSFLGYMQRRLSDFVAPDSLTLARPMQTDPEGQQTNPLEDASAIVDGLDLAQVHDSSSADSSTSHREGSPSVHRAGLLQPKSYNANASFYLMPHNTPSQVSPHFDSHTPDSIRAATLQLSNMPFSASVPTGGGVDVSSFRSFNLEPSLAGLETLEPHEPTAQHPNDHTPSGSGFIFPQGGTLLSKGGAPTLRLGSTSGLSGLGFEPDQRSLVSQSLNSSFFREIPTSNSSVASVSASRSDSYGLEDSILTLPPPQSSGSSDRTDQNTSRGQEKVKATPERTKPSGISLLRPASSEADSSPAPSSRSSSVSSSRSVAAKYSPPIPDNPGAFPVIPSPPLAENTPTATPMGTPRPPFLPPLQLPSQRTPNENRVHWRSPTSLVKRLGPATPLTHSPERLHMSMDETTPLLSNHGKLLPSCSSSLPPLPHMHGFLLQQDNEQSHEPNGVIGIEDGWGRHTFFQNAKVNDTNSLGNHFYLAKETLRRELVEKAPEHVFTALKAIPAVLLGSLLNILDGVSYGMIIFPATGVFADLGPMGVSMFFLTTVVAQFVYAVGGSGFAGANGSMMIEVVPFFHIMATSIASQIGEDKPLAVIATTLVAYSLSSVLTGLAFFLLGALKLGVVVGFFPRHILVGCIGGVGAFLIETGLTVSMRISDDDFTMSWETFEFMFLNTHNLVLWTVPLVLAILLRLITHKYHHQLIFPAYFIIIPLFFYIVVFACGLDLGDLRRSGWVFDMSQSAHEPWYKFWSYYDFGLVHYGALWSTLPTQFALLFFNILHPPLNVPALAVSLNDDVDTNKELVAHGYSNFLAGIIGTLPNYLVYVNTLLFYRVGGGNRVAGFLLAVATAGLLVVGAGPIAFLPVMVVGALIFVLGIDLVKEALWDNRNRVTWSEYITIISIMVAMTAWDFVIGVLFGIIVCCFFFVVQNSQLRSIRAMYTGDLSMSAVRRPSLQRAYIREVSKQTTILRLQGFLFFGTITYVEETIRNLLEGPSWEHHPIQFLVLDLSLVAGVDMSSAEAFVRIHRLLAAKRVTLVFCGFTADSPIGKALRSVEVLGVRGVELFGTFNDAMEWTENAYLRAWFRSHKIETSPTSFSIQGRQDADIDYSHFVGSFVRSPRRSHLRDAGDRTMATEIISEPEPDVDVEPFNTLKKAFSSYGDLDPLLFLPISRYLERISVPAGHVLWRQGDPAAGLYIIESGVLRASYEFANVVQVFDESMVAGTVAGEMSALSDSPRNSTVVAEHSSVLWKLSNENIQRLQIEEPALARVFMQLVLKAAKLDYDVLLSAIASRQ